MIETIVHADEVTLAFSFIQLAIKVLLQTKSVAGYAAY
jgi:hypothetical protein